MADTVTVTSGAASTLPDGTKILTDDTGSGGHAQIIKLAISTDGSATLIPADATNGLFVSLATILDAANDQVSIGAKATGGCSVDMNLDVDESEDAVKASAGTLYGFNVTNRGSAVRYLKFYDATVASVTVGSTTPKLTIPVPYTAAGYTAAIMFGSMGIAFGTAITVAATTGFAVADTGAPGTNDIILNTFYA